MKRCVIVLATVIFVVSLVSQGNGKGNTVQTGAALSVSDVQADPLAYKGTITINGVVAGVSKLDPKLFAMVETKEALVCKQTGCAKFYLPIKYEDDIPKEWDEVNVTGSFVILNKKESFGKFYFKADSIQNLGRAIK